MATPKHSGYLKMVLFMIAKQCFSIYHVSVIFLTKDMAKMKYIVIRVVDLNLVSWSSLHLESHLIIIEIAVHIMEKYLKSLRIFQVLTCSVTRMIADSQLLSLKSGKSSSSEQERTFL